LDRICMILASTLSSLSAISTFSRFSSAKMLIGLPR
jgi:hypothetical protein